MTKREVATGAVELLVNSFHETSDLPEDVYHATTLLLSILYGKTVAATFTGIVESDDFGYHLKKWVADRLTTSLWLYITT